MEDLRSMLEMIAGFQIAILIGVAIHLGLFIATLGNHHGND
jgi:hypothetical protein